MIYYVEFKKGNIYFPRGANREKEDTLLFSVSSARKFLIVNHLNRKDSEAGLIQKQSEVHFKNALNKLNNFCGSSSCGLCPEYSNITNFACGQYSLYFTIISGTATRSNLPP